jgi:hypothetical protein
LLLRLETLLVRRAVRDLHGPQEFEVSLHSKGAEHETEEVARID